MRKKIKLLLLHMDEKAGFWLFGKDMMSVKIAWHFGSEKVLLSQAAKISLIMNYPWQFPL